MVGGRRVIKFRSLLVGGETAFEPYVAVQDASPTGSVETMAIEDVIFRLPTVPASQRTAGQEEQRFSASMLKAYADSQVAGVAGTAGQALTTEAAASEAAAQAKPSSGNLLATSTVTRNALNGSTVVTDAAGQPIGQLIPAGATGAGSFERAAFSVATIPAGTRLRVEMSLELSAGFLAAKGFITTLLHVVRPVGNVDNVGSMVSNTLDGTAYTRVFEFTTTAEDLTLVATMQVPTSAAAAGVAHSFRISGVLYQVDSNVQPATKAADMILDQRLQGLFLESGIGPLQRVYPKM